MTVNLDIHIYQETPIDAHRLEHDGSPVLTLRSRNGGVVSMFFNDDATAKRFAENLLGLIGLPSGPPPSLDEALNSGDGVYRP